MNRGAGAKRPRFAHGRVHAAAERITSPNEVAEHGRNEACRFAESIFCRGFRAGSLPPSAENRPRCCQNCWQNRRHARLADGDLTTTSRRRAKGRKPVVRAHSNERTEHPDYCRWRLRSAILSYIRPSTPGTRRGIAQATTTRIRTNTLPDAFLRANSNHPLRGLHSDRSRRNLAYRSIRRGIRGRCRKIHRFPWRHIRG